MSKWQPSDWLTLAAIVASALVGITLAGWSHLHDYKMRQKDWAEQRAMRQKDWAEQRKLHTEARDEEFLDRWLQRAQELAVDARAGLMNDLDPSALSLDHEGVREVVIEVYDRNLKPRLQTMVDFSPEERIREAAEKVDRRIWRLINRLGALVAQDESSPDHGERELAAKRAYGEAHYAVDELREAAGGRETVPRDDYALPLETDPLSPSGR